MLVGMNDVNAILVVDQGCRPGSDDQGLLCILCVGDVRGQQCLRSMGVQVPELKHWTQSSVWSTASFMMLKMSALTTPWSWGPTSIAVEWHHQNEYICHVNGKTYWKYSGFLWQEEDCMVCFQWTHGTSTSTNTYWSHACPGSPESRHQLVVDPAG